MTYERVNQFTVSESDRLEIAENDTFAVNDIDIDGSVGGDGTLISDCQLMDGEPDDTVNLVCMAPDSSTPLSSPVVSDVVVGENDVTITFIEDANAVSTTLEYDTDQEFSSAVTVLNFTSGSSVTGLVEGTVYHVRIKSIGDGTDWTDSDYSAVYDVDYTHHPVYITIESFRSVEEWAGDWTSIVLAHVPAALVSMDVTL